jgi:peroxiredoxin Q/BCP
VASHQRFRDKYNLTVSLLADPQRVACAAYDVLKDGGGLKRQSFVIDEDGRIATHYAKVDASVHAAEAVHAAEVLAALTK